MKNGMLIDVLGFINLLYAGVLAGGWNCVL
jgi:hypothetical protein